MEEDKLLLPENNENSISKFRNLWNNKHPCPESTHSVSLNKTEKNKTLTGMPSNDNWTNNIAILWDGSIVQLSEKWNGTKNDKFWPLSPWYAERMIDSPIGESEYELRQGPCCSKNAEDGQKQIPNNQRSSQLERFPEFLKYMKNTFKKNILWLVWSRKVK